MKSFRLVVHQKNFSAEELIINPKDYPGATLGDIVEIYHPEDCKSQKQESDEDFPHLLLQIKSFQDDSSQQNPLQKDTISVEQSIAQTFGLQTYKQVNVHIVDPSKVALDSIELTFKDQYMGRSEMWRLKNSLVNTCAYTKRNIEFCSGAVRCQVYEMWSQGDRVACGVITEETKVVFRSSTSMVYLFLQMSSEMWDFDIYGDLYFEKAVNGFLSDLFLKWKKNGCNHEVTIVLFSRTFYEANTLEEFPWHMRECLQKDYRGRYYEDFYRVAVQNERYDDWSGILVQLRRIFSEYLKLVLEYHKRPDCVIPAATNSTAAQGNFLEVLNMSLNVFEKHYLDRSFDRTGQLSVVITPGVGVFEVDRELTNITKQRIIDNGVGSDLVCVGEQPLHAVPLLKFHNKDTHLNVPDDYSMPHWINLSFYSTNKKIAYSNFVPRIKLPSDLPEPMANETGMDGNKRPSLKTKLVAAHDEYIHQSIFDYDAYDAQIFQLPSLHDSGANNHRAQRYKRTSGSLLDAQDAVHGQRRKMSDPDLMTSHRPPPLSGTGSAGARSIGTNARSEPIAIPPVAAVAPLVSPQADVESKDLSPGAVRMVVGSEGSPPLESRALINPFDPSHVTIKLTSNRRRWTHIFPKGPTGVLIQQHHYQAIPTPEPASRVEAPSTAPAGGTVVANTAQTQNNNGGSQFVVTAALHEYCKKRPNNMSSTAPKNPSKSLTLLWGATGEQEWTSALTTGVDWKSLTIPACLPITTDYFPEQRSLNIDYVVSLYSLLPDTVNADFCPLQRSNIKRPLTTAEVFTELISQRLAQGFQLILMAKSAQRKNDGNRNKSLGCGGGGSTQKCSAVGNAVEEDEQSYYLSIGRLFHKIYLSGNTIVVTRYRPRHPYPGFNYQYRYRFYAPYHDTYEESYATFTTEKLEHFNWNYLDLYVCTNGDNEFGLDEALKYWRFRVYLLPLNNQATKKIIDSGGHLDAYGPTTQVDHQLMVEGLLKFVETAVNKIKKNVTQTKKARMSLSVVNNAPLIQPRRNSMSNFSQNVNSSPFRERLGSNRLTERPRPRSGSKVLERSRGSTGSTEHSADPAHETMLEENGPQSPPCLKSTSTPSEIVESMRNPITGLTFVVSQQNLPSYTFVVADAVNWLQLHMESVGSVEKAMSVLEDLYAHAYIRHASGDPSQRCRFGFQLFSIVTALEEGGEGTAADFEDEWLEVKIEKPLNWGLCTGQSSQDTQLPQGGATAEIGNKTIDEKYGVPHFLCEDINVDYLDSDGPTYRRMRLETDVTGKSDRVEWGHIRYQTTFVPDQAYELVVEWLTSSGSIVAELLSSWHRKAQACNLQMIPIPHDPLALPYSNKSDPLRGPIFVPLNIKCLEERDRIFKEFRECTHPERLFLLQEAIVQRFGFIHCTAQPSNSKHSGSREHQYIHCTGTVFILITRPMNSARSRVPAVGNKPRSTGRFSVHADVVSSPHEAYITRHVSGKNKDDYDNSRKMGFLWCWNHMVSRRWRINQGVDTNFQVRMLKDFREFCANGNNRLRTFWEESWQTKEYACQEYYLRK